MARNHILLAGAPDRAGSQNLDTRSTEMGRYKNSLCVEKCPANSFEYNNDATRRLDGDLKLPVGRQSH
jgi:hypothetical protein